MLSRNDKRTDGVIEITQSQSSNSIEESTTKNNWLSTLAQITLGGVGIGAGILYLGPAQTCALSEDCGKWLSDLTSPTAAVVIFTAGGFDFSAGAMVMGAQSAE